ncbi:DUF1992 domain-containing protein [Paenibacillus psychroresistens]|uniref:DUF1992 domain-containing protein n=1 Tax=Paenibacillus psychroresistens TaxID=1778678 RepID=A0A6B8RW69_9BACL|nr:DUF1992 domain-containing protein [Paenibacillus psychroresistens]QGQ99456.1 DUF1992 domain-containing protein [Paenibacillus psychroresistens]
MSFFGKSKQNAIKSEVLEDAPQTIANERMLARWLDQIYTDYEKDGGFEKLPGKGKPINLDSGDPLNGMLKNANILPVWLDLQHEIRDAIQSLINRLNNQAEYNPDDDMDQINKKIKKYNSLVPLPILQKGHLSKESVAEQLERWI